MVLYKSIRVDVPLRFERLERLELFERVSPFIESPVPLALTQLPER